MIPDDMYSKNPLCDQINASYLSLSPITDILGLSGSICVQSSALRNTAYSLSLEFYGINFICSVFYRSANVNL